MINVSNQEYLKCLELYLVDMMLAQKMFDSKIISLDDYEKIENKIAQKYCIKTNSIYRSNNLINSPPSGNITH